MSHETNGHHFHWVRLWCATNFLLQQITPRLFKSALLCQPPVYNSIESNPVKVSSQETILQDAICVENEVWPVIRLYKDQDRGDG